MLHGTAVEIAEGLNAHLEAGADQVVIQQLGKEGPDLLPGYEALATVLELVAEEPWAMAQVSD